MEQNAKQKLMKDFRFLEIITDILYYPFKNQAYDISDLTNEDKEIVTIFKLAFRVILSMWFRVPAEWNLMPSS